MMLIIHCFLTIILLISHFGQVARSQVDAYDELGKTTAQLVRLRGFEATEYNLTTADGYILNLVQACSPLVDKSIIASRPPVLFIHGFFNSGNTWLINSDGAQPHDYSVICSNASKEQLQQLSDADPSFNSVAFTFMNCGREVWIVNRRGNTLSRGYANSDLAPYDDPLTNFYETFFGGLPSLSGLFQGFIDILSPPTLRSEALFTGILGPPYSPRYWNFSLDEEARYDIPETIDFVLQKTNQSKLDIVAHSAGGQLTLMAQILQPELANKIGKTLFYAPAMYLYESTGALFAPLVPLLVSYTEQSFPDFITIPTHTSSEVLCATQFAQYTACSFIYQLIVGPGGLRDPVRPGYEEALLDTTSSHESAHLIQVSLRKKTHFYDYLDANRNQIAYGQPAPPLYDVSKVNSSNIAIWFGNSDALVPPKGVRELVKDLRVPVEEHFIDVPGVLWNHYSFFLDKDIPTLLTIPSVVFLETTSSTR